VRSASALAKATLLSMMSTPSYVSVSSLVKASAS